MTSEYERSARIYDLLYVGAGIMDYLAEATELHRIIQEACPAAKTLLDVACGTGMHLAVMRRWHEVEGVDISPAMLIVARGRLPGVELHLGDMRDLELGKTFDVVMCLFSGIAYVTDPAEMRKTIARMAAHVAPGGLLIVDGWVRPDEWRDNFRRNPDVVNDGDTMVVRVSVSRRDGAITELEMHHLVQTEAGVEYFVEHHRLALTKTEEYVAAVEAAGLDARVIPDYMPARDRVIGVRPGLTRPAS